MSFVLPPPVPPSVPVTGGAARFPVRRVFCIGRNYAAHAREMGHDPDREDPFFFMKPADSLVPEGGEVPYPPATKDLHHEGELVIALSKGGAGIPVETALDHVWAYGVGIDLTRRDIQGEAKKAGRPWDMGKGFDQSAPISALTPVSTIGHPAPETPLTLSVNGETRQSSTLGHMIWSVPEMISYLSKLVTLAPGDLIFTGTPEGVAAVVTGDEITAAVPGIGSVTIRLS